MSYLLFCNKHFVYCRPLINDNSEKMTIDKLFLEYIVHFSHVYLFCMIMYVSQEIKTQMLGNASEWYNIIMQNTVHNIML